jgi:hypothetical protein
VPVVLTPLPRRVTLVLCTRAGSVLGALPAYDVVVPWWQETRDVVADARARHGVEVTVLRLLRVGAATEDGHREVSYLAELCSDAPRDLLPVDGDPLADHPLRLPYARPGGPAADLAWAAAALAARDTPVVGRPVQMRTWNLSAVWRLPTASGAAWLKVVPPFFAHEGRILERLDRDVAPPLVAADGPRVLLEEVPGNDQYGASVPLLVRMVSMLVGLQAGWVDRVAELELLGLPDWRPAPFAAVAARALSASASADQLDMATARQVGALIDGLGERFASLAEAGVPDTLVHGDFHPGNVCGSAARLVLLDWGDCGIGSPMLDQAAFLDGLTPADASEVQEVWADEWRTAVPGCDPHRAASLLAPVAALRKAIVYQMFLDAIEPDERIYHEEDPAGWLRQAAALSTGRR